IYGWSLGSGAATQVAADVDEAALVLEGAFTSVADVAAEIYPYLPVRWLLRHPFASHSRIGRAGSPVLLLHARDDEVVPFAHAERLHAAATGLRQLVPLSGGHVHPNLAREDDYLRALHGFLGAALDVPLARPPRSLVSLLLDAADAGEAARAEALALAERVGAGTETGFNAASYAVGYAVRRWRSVDAAAADALAAAAARRCASCRPSDASAGSAASWPLTTASARRARGRRSLRVPAASPPPSCARLSRVLRPPRSTRPPRGAGPCGTGGPSSARRTSRRRARRAPTGPPGGPAPPPPAAASCR